VLLLLLYWTQLRQHRQSAHHLESYLLRRFLLLFLGHHPIRHQSELIFQKKYRSRPHLIRQP
jgi:hypothetical protein